MNGLTETQRRNAESRARRLYALTQNLPLDFDKEKTELASALSELHTEIAFLVQYLTNPY